MKKQLNRSIVVLAAGGTGGHIFPAQGLAEELTSHNFEPFLICDERSQDFLHHPFDQSNTQVFKIDRFGGGVLKNLGKIFKLLITIFKIYRLLRKLNAQAVVGFGGYTTFPTIIAALLSGTAIYTHEQNAVIGRVNRIFLPFVKKVFLSFPQTRLIAKKYQKKTVMVGNIIRSSVLSILKSKIKKASKSIKILIIGGSLGSKIITDIVPHALARLGGSGQAIEVYQQARLDSIEEVSKIYQDAKIKAEVKSFFDNIGELMITADIVIARSGASTIFELALAKKPAILVPLKIAIDNHQFYNAEFLREAGAAIVMTESEFTVEALEATLNSLLKGEGGRRQLAKMKAGYRDIDVPQNPAKKMVDIMSKSWK